MLIHINRVDFILRQITKFSCKNIFWRFKNLICQKISTVYHTWPQECAPVYFINLKFAFKSDVSLIKLFFILLISKRTKKKLLVSVISVLEKKSFNCDQN